MDQTRNDELKQEYARLAHAMQSGVAFEQSRGSNDGSPKHLRVGVNAAMSDMGGLVDLLIAKGVITETEYLEAIVTRMRAEVASYEARANAQVGGAHITFG